MATMESAAAATPLLRGELGQGRGKPYQRRADAIAYGDRYQKAAALVDLAEDGVGIPEDVLTSDFERAVKFYFLYIRFNWLWSLNIFALLLLNFLERPLWLSSSSSTPVDRDAFFLGAAPFLHFPYLSPQVSSFSQLQDGGPVADEEDREEAGEELQEATERPQDLRQAKLEEAEGYRLPRQEKVQGMHSHAQHWVRLGQEDPPLPPQWLQEVCRSQCLRARTSDDAQQDILC